MSVAADALSLPRAQDRTLRINRRAPGTWVLWVCVFLSGFVIREPAPFDLVMVPVIAGWFAFGGLGLHRQFASAFFLMILFLAGGVLATTQVSSYQDVPLYMSVSAFMVGLFFFFANLIGSNSHSLAVIRNAYVASATVAATFGILGYFGAFPGAETFTLYDRARGTFEDPNVFGPFLVLAAVFLAYDMLTAPIRRTVWLAPLLAWLLFAIFLSFSRAAWGLTVLSLVGVTLTVFVADRRPTVRLRLIVIAAAGAVLLAAGLAVALSFDVISEMFATRAKLLQPYDADRIGRFARFQHGFAWAFESPLGIGPFGFRSVFPEDPHNIYLKSFLAYGWLGGLAYWAFTLFTLLRGFPLLFRGADWTPYYRCAYIVFFGHALVGIIIDTDHWRHLFMIYGIVWGCFILDGRERRFPPPAQAGRRAA